ncbi:MAG: hypothetical protein QXF55_00015 [Candidatus Aenigmatarchaeota archaeon]
MRASSVLIAAALMLALASARLLSPTGAGTADGNVAANVMAACAIPLAQGWNYISLCAQPDNTSIQSVLQNVSYRYVMVWNSTSQEFEIYSPRSASPPFDSFDTNSSYFVLYDGASPTMLNVPGAEFNDTNISMLYGWNPPAWPYIFTANISCYLSSIANQYRYAMKWNATPQEFIIYSPRASVPQFTTISMGEGQFILVINSSGATLQYNKTACGG